MQIHPSLLASDLFCLKSWLKKNKRCDAFHVDFIDPTFAATFGLSFSIIEKLHEGKFPFVVHYMAAWNDELIQKIVKLQPQMIFFHTRAIHNMELFNNINAGIALELGEKPTIDVPQYLIMNVRIGFSNQPFNNENIPLSHKLKSQGKFIISDGGVNLDNLSQLKHFDAIVIGSALNMHTIEQFYEQL